MRVTEIDGREKMKKEKGIKLEKVKGKRVRERKRKEE